MPKIVHLRKNCIGCNACVEIAYDRWRMSKKDGKSVLLGAKEKKGIYQVDILFDEYDDNVRAAEACPVNIIQVYV
ncbi:ferredoxin [Arsenicibacter rosenii]|uniref:Ferredoxin n=1 Tax=Arsenicibacter rosenii TaxID=1750698 RepID=A0A1S2VQ80_9BACT|nr:ferredoxin [Arsenicibacter rosenii]OIN60375.1 ferredoxin [Arsenicibacter rosenii]